MAAVRRAALTASGASQCFFIVPGTLLWALDNPDSLSNSNSSDSNSNSSGNKLFVLEGDCAVEVRLEEGDLELAAMDRSLESTLEEGDPGWQKSWSLRRAQGCGAQSVQAVPVQVRTRRGEGAARGVLAVVGGSVCASSLRWLGGVFAACVGLRLREVEEVREQRARAEQEWRARLQGLEEAAEQLADGLQQTQRREVDRNDLLEDLLACRHAGDMADPPSEERVLLSAARTVFGERARAGILALPEARELAEQLDNAHRTALLRSEEGEDPAVVRASVLGEVTYWLGPEALLPLRGNLRIVDEDDPPHAAGTATGERLVLCLHTPRPKEDLWLVLAGGGGLASTVQLRVAVWLRLVEGQLRWRAWGSEEADRGRQWAGRLTQCEQLRAEEALARQQASECADIASAEKLRGVRDRCRDRLREASRLRALSETMFAATAAFCERYSARSPSGSSGTNNAAMVPVEGLLGLAEELSVLAATPTSLGLCRHPDTNTGHSSTSNAATPQWLTSPHPNPNLLPLVRLSLSRLGQTAVACEEQQRSHLRSHEEEVVFADPVPGYGLCVALPVVLPALGVTVVVLVSASAEAVEAVRSQVLCWRSARSCVQQAVHARSEFLQVCMRARMLALKSLQSQTALLACREDMKLRAFEALKSARTASQLRALRSQESERRTELGAVRASVAGLRRAQADWRELLRGLGACRISGKDDEEEDGDCHSTVCLPASHDHDVYLYLCRGGGAVGPGGRGAGLGAEQPAPDPQRLRTHPAGRRRGWQEGAAAGAVSGGQ